MNEQDLRMECEAAGLQLTPGLPTKPGGWVSNPLRKAIYARLTEEQGGEWCAICGEPPSDRRLAIDHDHACCPSGHFCDKCARGLLCTRCNMGIGALREDPDIIESARLYVSGRCQSWVPSAER